MDANLQFWESAGQSFPRRFKIWVNLLDPSLLLASTPEIQKAHSLLGSGEKLNEKNGSSAAIVSLSSVHADSGAVLPLFFRPPALFPVSGPLVIASVVSHSTVKTAMFWQLLLQTYYATFNHVHRNSSSQQGHKLPLEQLLLAAGTITYTTCFGALPQVLMRRFKAEKPPVQTFFKSILPIPLSAALAFANVFSVRSLESKTGIQVFNRDGSPVGLSKAAGKKAVRETALSRALLLGTSTAAPSLLTYLLNRTRFFQRNPRLTGAFGHVHVALVLGMMIPVSFSLFPQVGTIKREKLEEELQAGALDTHLYYHRGL